MPDELCLHWTTETSSLPPAGPAQPSLVHVSPSPLVPSGVTQAFWAIGMCCFDSANLVGAFAKDAL